MSVEVPAGAADSLLLLLLKSVSTGGQTDCLRFYCCSRFWRLNKGSEAPLGPVGFTHIFVGMLMKEFWWFVLNWVFSSLGVYVVTSADACCSLLLQYRPWPAGGALKKKKL